GLTAVREETARLPTEDVIGDEGQRHLRRTSSIRGNVSGEDIIWWACATQRSRVSVFDPLTTAMRNGAVSPHGPSSASPNAPVSAALHWPPAFGRTGTHSVTNFGRGRTSTACTSRSPPQVSTWTSEVLGSRYEVFQWRPSSVKTTDHREPYSWRSTNSRCTTSLLMPSTAMWWRSSHSTGKVRVSLTCPSPSPPHQR